MMAVTATPSSRRDDLAVSHEADVLEMLRQLSDGQRALTAKVDALTVLVQALPRGRSDRDPADVALLLAIAESIGDFSFTSAQVIAHSKADQALADALLAADVTDAQALGIACRRLEGVVRDGLRLDHVGRVRDGALWKVHVSET